MATVVVGVRTRSCAASSVMRIGPRSSSVNRIDSCARVRSAPPSGALRFGVAPAQDGEQLGEHLLQLSGQLSDLRFGLYHNSLV